MNIVLIYHAAKYCCLAAATVSQRNELCTRRDTDFNNAGASEWGREKETQVDLPAAMPLTWPGAPSNTAVSVCRCKHLMKPVKDHVHVTALWVGQGAWVEKGGILGGIA